MSPKNARKRSTCTLLSNESRDVRPRSAHWVLGREAVHVGYPAKVTINTTKVPRDKGLCKETHWPTIKHVAFQHSTTVEPTDSRQAQWKGANYLLNLSKLILKFIWRARDQNKHNFLKKEYQASWFTPLIPALQRPLSIWTSLGYTSSKPARTT